MLSLLIVAATELRRGPAARAHHQKIEGDRIQWMWEDQAIHELQRLNATEQRRRDGGLAHRKVPLPTVHVARSSSLRTWGRNPPKPRIRPSK